MATILDGYPQPYGGKMESVIEKAGDAAHYEVVSAGAAPTGGQAVSASEFGLKYLDHVEGGMDATGAYHVVFTPKVTGKGPVTSGILMWITAATGAEVVHTTDLSAKRVRLRAIGL